jgi:hypothetical protein
MKLTEDSTAKADMQQLARKRKDEAQQNYDVNRKQQYEFFLNSANGRKTKAQGVASWRANFSYPTTRTMIRSYVPRLVNGLIGPDGSNFFSMVPRKDEDAAGMSVRDSIDVMTAVQNAHMQNRGTFRGIIEATERNSCTFGVGFIIQTWQYEKQEWDYDIINEDGTDVKPGYGDKTVNEPSWYVPSTVNVWWDPGANTWEESTYAVVRRYSRLSQILNRAQRERYSEAEHVKNLVDQVATSLTAGLNQGTGEGNGDPANTSGVDPVEATYTIYTKDTWVTLWRDEMIDCRPNPLAHHNIPVYPFIFENDTYTFMPKGIPEILSDIQQAQDIHMNLMIDNTNINVNTILVKPATAWLDESNLRWEPGTIMTEHTPNTLRKLDLGSQSMGDSKLLMDNLAGLANQSLSTQDFMSAPAGIASVNKTYGGLRLINQEGNKQIAFIISSQKSKGLVPMLQDLKTLYAQFLGQADVTDILGPVQAARLNYKASQQIAWEGDYDYVINGDLSIIDKQAHLENIEQGMQLLGSLGYNVNKDVLAKAIIDGLDLDKAILLPAGAPSSVIQTQTTPEAAGQVNPNAVPNAMNPGNAPNESPKAGVAPPIAPAAPTGAPVALNTSNMAVPAPTDGNGPTNVTTTGGIQLAPQQEQLLQAIAQKLGVDPGHLILDVTSGIIPGGFQSVLKLSSSPIGRKQLITILKAGHKKMS